MGELCDFDVNGDLESLWSEELDRVPLKQRLKLLLKLEDFDATETGIDANVKREDEHFEPQVTHSACDTWEGISDTVSSEESGPEECNRREIGANDDVALPNYHVKLEPEIIENHSLSSLDTCQIEASIANVQECEMSTEGHEVFLDDLDHVVLKERRRMLLSRYSKHLVSCSFMRCLSTAKQVLVSCNTRIDAKQVLSDQVPDEREVLGFNKPVEGNISGLSSSVDFLIQQSDGVGNGECISDCNDSEMGASHLHDMLDENASGLLGASPIDTSPCLAFTHNCQGTTCTSGIFANMNESSGVNSLSCDQMTGLRSDLPIFANVKAEPVDSSDSQIPSKKAQDFVVLPVKSEAGFIDESLDDKIDHMLLRERMISRASKGMPSSATYGTSIFSRKIGPSSFDYSSAGSSKPQRMKRPRKRRKTATDSVETAMEEDAPGLLQILLEKGVLLDEIKLYNELESDEVLDDSLTENSFAELEAVILKLFSERQSLFKFAPIRCGKAERVSYCLACLISLVEQARYLQFRNWPVEWGWCRDLQSFIFVFERHNRIVLERPEYGYATYFFELTDSLSINWQIKRLVTAMKLTSCSRVTLIENRALTVGDDLTEGEAKVLMEYGWVPDTGLGTMLNYCDRVVHDRKNEKDNSEWRTKIGKLLLDGYNGGTIVSTDFSKHVTEHGSVQSPDIKLEH